MNLYDYEIASLQKEILNLQQTKQRDISQIKFAETTVENISLTTTTKRFKVEPANDVYPLISARVEFTNSTANNSWLITSWVMDNNTRKFQIYIDGNSPTTNATVNITFVSTSELIITEL